MLFTCLSAEGEWEVCSKQRKSFKLMYILSILTLICNKKQVFVFIELELKYLLKY
jgi:hypothetical protein